jgi:hypothetical protein
MTLPLAAATTGLCATIGMSASCAGAVARNCSYSTWLRAFFVRANITSSFSLFSRATTMFCLSSSDIAF